MQWVGVRVCHGLQRRAVGAFIIYRGFFNVCTSKYNKVRAYIVAVCRDRVAFLNIRAYNWDFVSTCPAGGCCEATSNAERLYFHLEPKASSRESLNGVL
jgi:hypothetical protein